MDRQNSHELTTHGGGVRFATTIGGALTGFGADWIIIDDPQNASEAYSEPSRERVKSFFQQTLLSRLNNPSQGKIVLVMQRLHEDDLSGHVLAGGGWAHLRLQAQATEDIEVPIGSGGTHQLKAGEYLLPSLFTPQWLEQQKADMGSALYEAQYQQQPVPAGGNMIKRSWLRYWEIPPAREGGRITLSLDTAIKENPANDYSACTVWLEQDGKHYLLDVWRDKVGFPDLLKQVSDLIGAYAPTAILIEDAGSGSALIQTLTKQGVPAIGRKARDPKPVRLASVSQYFESGLVWWPKDAPWLAGIESEVLGFPSVRHDDQVDSVSQYLGWVRERPRVTFSWDMGDDRVDHEIIADRLAMPRWR